MNHKTFVGTLTFVPHGENGPEHYFELENGEFLSLKFSGGMVDAMTVPMNQKIALCMSDVTYDGFHIVCSHKPLFTILESPQRLLSSTAKIKKHIGIFRQLPLDASDEAVATAQGIVDKHAVQMEDYWRRYARHAWDVKARGFVMKGEENAHPPTYARNDIARFMKENDMGDFEPNFFHVHGGYSNAMCGQGNRPGNYSVTYLSSACGIKTMVHELGHNFNLGHSNRLDGEDIVPYGDHSTVMGGTSVTTGLNTNQMMILGIEKSHEDIWLKDSKQLILCPPELSSHWLGENEWQNVRVRHNNNFAYIFIRKVKGAHYGGAKNQEHLYITLSDYMNQTTRLPIMFPGDTTELENGIVVEYLEYLEERARINVIFPDSETEIEEISIPTGFPKIIHSVSVEPEHTGLWYNKDFDGEGLDVQVKDGKAVLYWYTYNHKETSRRFYYGTADLTDGPVEFDLYTTVDGTWDDPTKRIPETAGKAQLYFFNSDNGVFNFDMYKEGKGTMEITPVAKSEGSPYEGVFFDPVRDGEGFTIQFFDGGDRCVALWYSYGPKKRGGIHNPPIDYTEQRWYLCQGNKNDDESYSLTVYEATGNVWMGLRYDPGVKPVGGAKLNIVDTNNMTFEFDLDSDTVTGNGTYNIRRLF